MNPTNTSLSSTILSDVSVPTPYLIMDLDNIAQKYDDLKKNLPGVNIFYAVKCNPEEPILSILKKKGSHFEIVSLGELHRLIKLGVNPEEVIYSNPVKPIEHIKNTYDLGLRYYSYDSPEELEKIAQYAPGSKVYLRMSVSNHGSLINLSNKFGANKSHAVALLALAEDLGLDPYGLAFHIGSQSENLQLWDQAFEDVCDVLDELQKHNIKLSVLNIGGGFPVTYTEKVPSIEKIGKVIQKHLRTMPYTMDFWCEPGRFLVGEAGVIAGTVIGKATRLNKPWIYLDVGRFQAFVEMFESDSLEYPIFTSIDGKSASKPTSLYTVTGPSCDSYDTISRDVTLPTNLKVGDKVYFATAGAYTHVYGAAFNDFPVPKVIYKQTIDKK